MTAAAASPVEGRLPELRGATAWLHTAPLTPEGLRGKVVAVQFCTFSCINWLRTVPYVRAWAEKYHDDGLVVLGVHSPEFPFEHDLDKIRAALDGIGIVHPIAVDNDFAVWRAFDNAYWPALYFADELYRVPRSWAERAYPKLVHYTRVAEGGHFAAWEQPQTLSEEVRATFRSLR